MTRTEHPGGQPARPRCDGPKQPYRRPALMVYGDVRRLTLHGTSKNRRDSLFFNTRT